MPGYDARYKYFEIEKHTFQMLPTLITFELKGVMKLFGHVVSPQGTLTLLYQLVKK